MARGFHNGLHLRTVSTIGVCAGSGNPGTPTRGSRHACPVCSRWIKPLKNGMLARHQVVTTDPAELQAGQRVSMVLGEDFTHDPIAQDIAKSTWLEVPHA